MKRILTFFVNGRPDRSQPRRSAALLAAVFALAGAGFSPAVSGELKARQVKNAAAAPVVNCTCRYRGTNYSLGDEICLNGPSGPRMATCDMVLNNTAWNFSKIPCPSASLTPAPMSIARLSWNR